MTTSEELIFSGKKFKFRGKIYKYEGYIPVPSIHMISEDGERFSFGRDAPIAKEFELIDK